MAKIKEKLSQDLTAAQKSNEMFKVSVFRLIMSDLQYAEKDKKEALTDDEELKVLSQNVKRRRDAIAIAKQADRPDVVKREEDEIKLIETYLPKQLSEGEVIKVVEETIKETGAASPADMGKVIGQAMKKLAGKADGSLVSKVVKEKLTAKK